MILSNLGLKPPSQWKVESVVDRIGNLIENLRNVKEAERIQQRLKNCKDNLKKLQRRLDKINNTRNEWVEKIQTAPSYPEIHSDDFSSMYWFLLQVKKWQEAHAQMKSLTARKGELEKEYKKEINIVNTLFEKSNFNTVNDVTEGKAILNELKDQESTRKENIRLIEQKNEKINEQKRLKQKNGQKLSSIYQSLVIDENDKESVRDLVKQLDDYKQNSKDHYAAEQAFLKKESYLKEHSIYNEYEGEIKTLSVDQVQEKANKNKDLADQLEDIQEQITSIETLIQEKKRDMNWRIF